ncbi:MAG: type II secretion system protein [Clostridia bacterium]|nr:type II secretion system protein [Clostridia bacterium]
MNKLRSKKAFTIVEMVIVIAVIAILAAVLIPTVSGVIQKANVSADQQFAASLNIQLALWEVDNGAIKNENDLRNAINKYYGEYDEDGNLKTDYYASFAPKSAKYGYHFWYDVENKIVVLNKYEDLDATAEVSLGFVLFGVAYADEEPAVEPADPAPVVITFSPESPRSLDIVGKNYFLLDQVGSDVVDQVNVIANINGNAEYGQAVALLEAAQKDSNLATNLVSRFKTTAIGNNFGVFFYSDWGTKATQVYVAYGVTELGSSKVAEGKYEVAEIYLPDTITLIGTGSLIGFKTIKDDPSTWEGSTTIYVNATVEEITGTNTIVARDSFDCVLEIPTGERFAFVGGVFTNLATNVSYETEYSVELEKFSVSGEGNNADFHLQEDRTQVHTIHVSNETTSFKLTAYKFIDENGNETTRPVSWKINGEEIGNTAELVLEGDNLSDGTVITVTAQNIVYTIKVEMVAIYTFTPEFLGGTAGKPSTEDGVVVTPVSVKYESSSSWTITSEITPTKTCANIVVDNGVTLDLSGDGANNLLKNGTTLTIKENVNGQFTVDVTVTTKGKDADGNNMKWIFRVSFDEASSIFTLAGNANTQEKYGSEFTIGTKNTITLGTLFALKDGKTVDSNKIEVRFLNNGEGNDQWSLDTTKDNWEDWELKIPASANGENYTITISNGGKECPLEVTIVLDAYNVANVAQWKSAGSSIVLLKDIVLGTEFNDTSKTVTYMNGNYHVIDATSYTFKAPLTSENKPAHTLVMFIGMSSGTIEQVVINGPVYPESILSSDSASKPYFAPGLRVSGKVTINNCYVSGFFSPVRVDSGTITIKDSVLEGGINSNVHVYNGTQVILENTLTIQRSGGYTETFTGKGNKVIGAGVFCDTAADGTSIVLKGKTEQYNWLSENDKYSSKTVSTVIDYLFKTNKDCDGNVTFEYDEFIHVINNVNYVNMGVAQEKRGKTVTVDASQITSTYVNAYDKVVEQDGTAIAGSYLTSGAAIWSCKGSTACSHALNPADLTNDGIYNYLDFLKSRS